VSALSALTPIDITAISLILIGGIMGAIRGLAGELAGLVSAGIAFTTGLLALNPFGTWLIAHSRLSHESALASAFSLTVVFIWLLLLIPKLLIGKVMKVVVERAFDRIAGVIAGSLRMIIWVLVLFLTMQLIPHPYLNRQFGEASLIGRGVIRISPRLLNRTHQTMATTIAPLTHDLPGKILAK
jgi:uncharacterized membrane protein required for colicin V production